MCAEGWFDVRCARWRRAHSRSFGPGVARDDSRGTIITAASAIVKQDWEVNFELGGQEEATLAGQLQAACQLVSPDCVLASEGSSRRHMESDDTVEVTKMRALQTSTGTATLRRSLTTGPLNGEISNLAANSGVAVTSINFIGAQAALVISQQGSAVEAQQLRSGSLAPNLVRATVAALLGLSATDVEVSVEEPIFPPMPPGRGDTARWGLRVGGFGRERGGRGGGVGLAQVRWRCRVGLARYGDRAAPFCLFCFLGIFGPKFL